VILSTRFGNTEVREPFIDADRIPPPGTAFGIPTYSGKRVTPTDASGLPVVMAAIRLLSETMGMLDLIPVNKRGQIWEPVPDAPQASLLAWPNELQSPFSMWSFAIASMNGWGGSFQSKAREIGRNDVRELIPMHPAGIKPRLSENGWEVVFDVYDKGVKQTLSRHDVLYTPAILFDSPWIGVSPITVHRHAIGSQLALEEFMGRFYSNDATPGVVLKLEHERTPEERSSLRESFGGRHQGVRNSHLPGVVWGDLSIEQMGVSPRDAEYVARRRLGYSEAALIFRLPRRMLVDDSENTPDSTDPANDDLQFVKYTLGPWIHRISGALLADRDIFPEGPRGELQPMFVTTELLRLDAKAQAETDHRLRQAGLATPNELRPHYGFAPHPEGENLQATPVGGAPNPSSDK
jgi:HK97 family phage portal protein